METKKVIYPETEKNIIIACLKKISVLLFICIRKRMIIDNNYFKTEPVAHSLTMTQNEKQNSLSDAQVSSQFYFF